MYRILLADDEGIMLESLKKIIESEYGNECEIHCAKSGRVVVHIRRISVSWISRCRGSAESRQSER